MQKKNVRRQVNKRRKSYIHVVSQIHLRIGGRAGHFARTKSLGPVVIDFLELYKNKASESIITNKNVQQNNGLTYRGSSFGEAVSSWWEGFWWEHWVPHVQGTGIRKPVRREPLAATCCVCIKFRTEAKERTPAWHAYYQKGRDLDGKLLLHFFDKKVENGNSLESAFESLV